MSAKSSGNGICSIDPTWKFSAGSPVRSDSDKSTDVLNGRGIRVEREHLTSGAQQIYEIAAITRSGIEHAHAGGDITAQDLIE